MQPWNLVVTSRRGGERGLLKELRFFGRFRPTGFHDVVAGFVEDRARFFDDLLKGHEMRDPVWRFLVRVVPVDAVFSFTVDTFRERLGEVVDAMADRVPPGPFYVRIERRGHKGEIPTPEVEREMDGRIIAAHERRGLASRVDFKEYSAVVAVETLRDVGGVGLVLREAIGRYPFLKLP
ncbi:MAG: hypothetical protein ACM3NF_05810 [Gemmatimonadota bacterium]